MERAAQISTWWVLSPHPKSANWFSQVVWIIILRLQLIWRPNFLNWICWQLQGIGHLNEFQLENYLHYLSSIPYVTVDEIPVQSQALVSSLGPFWGVMAKSRRLSVKITYGGEVLDYVYPVNADISVVSFRIDRSRISNSILYSPLANNSNQADIIVNYGRYIDCLKIFDAPDHLSGHPLYECVIFQPLKYCTRLNRL